ncbi:16S rRNA (guanine(527)-N(7))-methyltransferase RsmG [Amnibacterium flavum]|uniref:Ribosomal RNA small subunit methyltransferase G n=1 Tax=Amnibacterium flavum TaxID=2173173 RepID=A0A2V1HSD0_9MICO|nr:16S rRNA (guanine(527)-N(7))-methyltransferase RsmG [Amnibacterium flavum]PVZ95478.1 16S rRNA (guanine(527)-N(7))-methyltransferase RsmG [Amnibacterium flavum]
MVPRETAESFDLEPEPALAAELFGAQIEHIRRFAALLASQGETLGLIGPLELPRLWTRHIVNCALLAPLVHDRTADVGSGAGLPGLVLAIARPDVSFTLIEPMERRTDWLSSQARELELDNVTVLRARAEEAPKASFDVVTARAVGALSKLIPLTAPLVSAGGELVLLKGATVEAEIAAAAKVVTRFRLREARVEVLGDGMPTEPTRVFRARVE